MDNLNEKINQILNTEPIKSNPTCYIYDLDIIDKQIENIQKYAPSNISLYYAMKANPNLKILEHIAKNKFVKGVEIASTGELEKAENYYNHNQILFTGPGKTEKELYISVKNKIRLINVESVVEAIRINNIAEELNINKVPILLRINLNYYVDEADEFMAGISTKMGIDQNTFIEEFKHIRELKHLDIKGLHVFCASGVLDYKGLVKYADFVFAYVKSLQDKVNFKIDVIDFGGGIGIDYTYQNREFDTKSYFKELKDLIEKYNFENREIIMELGKYLVGPCGFYVSRIIDIKDIKNYKHIVLAGGVNHMRLPIATDRKHPLYVIQQNIKPLYETQPRVSNEKVDIEGPLCMNEDKISWDEFIKSAEIGDLIVVRQSGAYCYSASTLKFLSHYLPEEIILQEHFDE